MRCQLAVRPERGECTGRCGDLCRRLDGLPLALELAAARMAAFAPTEVVRRLDNVLRIASGGPRNAPLRQQTLEATIAWSYALLDESERSLYRRLAVFAGGFSLDGAQAVAAGDLDAFDVLPRLISRSIVQVDPQPDGGIRYRLLEPLRQFGYARLVESDELESARARQVEYLIELAESIGLGAPPGAVRADDHSGNGQHARLPGLDSAERPRRARRAARRGTVAVVDAARSTVGRPDMAPGHPGAAGSASRSAAVRTGLDRAGVPEHAPERDGRSGPDGRKRARVRRGCQRLPAGRGLRQRAERGGCLSGPP